MTREAKPGDIVTVTECSQPWIYGTWRGRLVDANAAGEKWVVPLDPSPSYTQPFGNLPARGLYLNGEDKVEVAADERPGAPCS